MMSRSLLGAFTLMAFVWTNGCHADLFGSSDEPLTPASDGWDIRDGNNDYEEVLLQANKMQTQAERTENEKLELEKMRQFKQNRRAMKSLLSLSETIYGC
ncbi:MAG: hypothetical protein LBQ43_05105 [Holosporales bacterium]|jgi:hypothetical protein|nr:hypothetical protein [Holosporales bacterium]